MLDYNPSVTTDKNMNLEEIKEWRKVIAYLNGRNSRNKYKKEIRKIRNVLKSIHKDIQEEDWYDKYRHSRIKSK